MSSGPALRSLKFAFFPSETRSRSQTSRIPERLRVAFFVRTSSKGSENRTQNQPPTAGWWRWMTSQGVVGTVPEAAVIRCRARIIDSLPCLKEVLAVRCSSGAWLSHCGDSLVWFLIFSCTESLKYFCDFFEEKWHLSTKLLWRVHQFLLCNISICAIHTTKSLPPLEHCVESLTFLWQKIIARHVPVASFFLWKATCGGLKTLWIASTLCSGEI